MTTKGNFFAGNLARQNIGDCSLFELPVLFNEPKEKKTKLNKDAGTTKEKAKKVSAIIALTVVIGLIVVI